MPVFFIHVKSFTMSAVRCSSAGGSVVFLLTGNSFTLSNNLIAQEFPFWTQVNADCKDLKYEDLIE